MSGMPGTKGAPQTLILSRRDIAALMDPAAYLEAVEGGFRAAAEGRAHSPPPMTIEGAGGTFHAKGASLRLDRLFTALKLNGNFPDNPTRHGLPTIQGALLLCDGETGSLLAVMDSIEITLRRTAAATALAARHLARPDAQSLLICGCGGQALAQIEALSDVLPLRRCLAWDRDLDKAAALVRTVRETTELDAEVASELAGAASMSDVIVTCTTSRAPFLSSRHVREGTFVAAVGTDSPEKSEIEPELMARSRVVADVLSQCLLMGDLQHAVAAGTMTAVQVHAELADLVAGRRKGRTDRRQITLFDSTGTGLQDVASAASIYHLARGQAKALSVDLGGT
jgi:ornithine cyclodeaminase/alanine dehydrogenase-like protein (mu-crystallin family)